VEPQAASAAGVGASLRSLGSALLDAIGTRAELALTELREEGERRREMLVLGLVGGLFLALALLLAALFVVLLFWDAHRLAALGGVTLLYSGVAAWALALLRAKQRASPAPFEATLRELAADRELLGRQGE